MLNNRQNRDTEGFYKVMDDYYHNNLEEKHSSPTKRLISHKNSTADHKKAMHGNINRGEYSLTYCTAPGKSYVIEPQGGQIDYDLHKKNPDQFYNQVFSQQITQHKVKGMPSPTRRSQTVQIKSKVTTRPYMKIIEKVKTQLIQMLAEKLGIEFRQDEIIEAMDAVDVYKQIKSMVAQGNLQIVDQGGKPLTKLQQQMTVAAQVDSDEEFDENELKRINDDIGDEMSPEEMELAGRSPDFKRGGNARLNIQGEAMQNLEDQVRSHIVRKNSEKREQE